MILMDKLYDRVSQAIQLNPTEFISCVEVETLLDKMYDEIVEEEVERMIENVKDGLRHRD